MAVKKVKFGVSDAEGQEVEGSFYDGPVPPKGVYRVRLKFLRLKTNKNGDPMLNGILEIDEKGEKAKFNGYGIWFNQNVTKQGAGYVNNFLDALGFSRKAFWGAGVTLDTDDDPPTVTKIGTKTINDPVCRIRTKLGKWDGDERLEVAGAGFMPATATDGEDDEAWDEEAEEVDEAAGSEEPVGEDDEEEDGEEEPDEEDETEESDTANWTWLLTLDRAGLKEFNTANKLGVRVTKNLSDDDLRQAVADAAGIAADLPESEDEDEDEDEDEPEAEEADGYTDETLPDDRPALVKIAREEFGIRVLRKHTPGDLKALILEAQSAAGEEEDPAAPPF